MKTRSGVKSSMSTLKNKNHRTVDVLPLKSSYSSEDISERMLCGAEVKDLCRLCLSEASRDCVKMCGTSAKACEIRFLYQTVMHKEVELHDALPKNVCAVCVQDLKTCGEIVERFKQADEYLQDIVQSPMFVENDTWEQDQKPSMNLNSENSSPKKAVVSQKKLKFAKEAAKRGSNFKVTPDKDLVNSSLNVRPAASTNIVHCDKASSQTNGNAGNHKPKQEIHNTELEDSTKEHLVSPHHLKNHTTEKPHSAKVTFKKEVETFKPILENIDNCLKVDNQNVDDSSNFSIEILSPSTQEPDSSQYYEIIVGPKSLMEPVSNSDNTPQGTAYKCDMCSMDLGNASALTAHKKKEHPDTKMRCPDPTCDYGMEFNSTVQLDEHYKKRHGLKCTMCDHICLTSSILNRHLAKEHKVGESLRHLGSVDEVVETQSSSQDPVQSVESSELETGRVCWICGAVLKNNVYLDRHIVTMHWEKKHICVICDKGFPTELALKTHVKIHDSDHKLKRFFCEHCPKSFWSKYYLKEHLLVHSSLKPFVCETCGFGFVRKRNLLRHRDLGNMMGFCPKPKKKKSEPSLNAENLNLTDSSQSYVRFTSNVEKTNGEKFECDICERKFIRKNNYDRHKKYHLCNGNPEIIKKLLEEPEIQECGICKRVLLSKVALQLHVSGHTNSKKPFQCEFCDKSFSVASDYRAHERLHTGETPFQCSHCGQKFYRKSHLEIHESKHSDDKPFECPICRKAFKRRRLLLNHTFTHKEASRAIRPYHCTQCRKGFLTQQHLTRHLKTHNQEKTADWYHCSECGKGFKLFKSLKRHIKSKHVENAATVEVVEESEECEHQENDSAFQFLHIVDNEEIVENEQFESFPFVVIDDECVVSS